MQSILKADWGPALKRAARVILAAAVAAYLAGEALGQMVHKLNNLLAAAWRRLLAGTRKECLQVADHVSKETPFVDHVAPIHAPQPPAIHRVAPLGGIAADDPAQQVLILQAQGLSQRQIAAAMGISRWKVRRALAAA